MKGSSTLLALPLALALLLGGAAHAADGIESRPLQFAKGASSATVKGSIAGRQTIDYKLRARAGQTMSVTLKSGNPGLAFNVLPPGSQDVAIEGAIAQQNWSGTLPADGEYTVRTYLDRAGARRGEKASYTLTVAIDAAAAQSGGKESAALAATGRAAEGKFNATGPLACARAKGQPMGQCEMGVARAGGGTATVVVTHPDGRKRFIFFEKGKAVGADLSQADGNMTFRATKNAAGIYLIDAGDERYEIPESVIFGGQQPNLLRARPPIRLSLRTTDGQRNLVVGIGGGGLQAGNAELKFDGHTYPLNPTVPPAEPVTNLDGTEILVPAFESYRDGKPVPSGAG